LTQAAITIFNFGTDSLIYLMAVRLNDFSRMIETAGMFGLEISSR